MNPAESIQESAPRPIPALTTLRFFAALLVVLFHHGQGLVTEMPAWCQVIVRGGYVGVPFFFVLSGFILAYNYLPASRRGTLDNGRFWVARFARVYPIYAVALVLGAPLFLEALGQMLPGEEVRWRFGSQALLSFGLVQSWIPQRSFAWNGPAWSLSVETFFYLLFPFLAARLSTKGRWNVLGGLMMSAVLLVAVSRWLGGNVIVSAQQLLGWANPILWLPLFLLGICMGDLHLARASSRKLPHGHPLPSGGREAGGEGAFSEKVQDRRALMLGLLTVAVIGLLALAMGSSLQRRSQLLFCYAVTVPCALLIYLLADQANPLRRILAWRGLVLMGEASYSLYILHRPLHDWFLRLEQAWGWPASSTLLGASLYLGCCLALSVAALKWIEHPCRDWIKRGFPTRPQPAQAPPVSGVPAEPKPTFIR